MGQARISGQTALSGGGGLSINIASGAMLPETVVDGQVFVVTDQDVTNYYISTNEPEAPVAGDVWVQVQERWKIWEITTGNPFLHLGVASAYQHDGTAWFQISGYVSISGEWVMIGANVFGVMWDYANSSTQLTRLTTATDPYGWVNVDITTDPVAAVGTGNGSSPFDVYPPWNGMEEYNIIDGVVAYKKGDIEFSRTNYDTMVYIPEFWYRVVDDALNQKRYYYISDLEFRDFEKHPGSGKYVARYKTISGYSSKSGASPLVSITRADARTGSKGKGSQWSLYDFASWCAVQMLFLVEFADWDSQAVVGRGYVDGKSSAVTTGGTNGMVYHTGRAAGTDGSTQVQYRNIEDPWGNVYEWIDGANFYSRAAYICTDRNRYADDTATGYTAAGVTLPSSNGYTKGLGMSTAFPWAYLPNVQGGSETTYIPDYVYSNTGWRVLLVSGFYNYASGAGLWSFAPYYDSSRLYEYIGARLLYHPEQEETV